MPEVYESKWVFFWINSDEVITFSASKAEWDAPLFKLYRNGRILELR